MLWHTQPLTSLGGLAEILHGSPPGRQHLPIISASWLDCDTQPGPAEDNRGYLAASTDDCISLIEVICTGSSKAVAKHNVSFQLLCTADIPAGCHSLQSLCSLPGSDQHLLVGALSQHQQPSAQTDLPGQVSGNALAVWEVTLPPQTVVAEPGQEQRQGQQLQAQIALLTCPRMPLEGAAAVTCIQPAAESHFQLVVGTAAGSVLLLKVVAHGQEAELKTVRELICKGELTNSIVRSFLLGSVMACTVLKSACTSTACGHVQGALKYTMHMDLSNSTSCLLPA